jgi:hypothetical protein
VAFVVAALVSGVTTFVRARVPAEEPSLAIAHPSPRDENTARERVMEVVAREWRAVEELPQQRAALNLRTIDAISLRADRSLTRVPRLGEEVEARANAWTEVLGGIWIRTESGRVVEIAVQLTPCGYPGHTDAVYLGGNVLGHLDANGRLEHFDEDTRPLEIVRRLGRPTSLQSRFDPRIPDRIEYVVNGDRLAFQFLGPDEARLAAISLIAQGASVEPPPVHGPSCASH